MKPRAVVFDLYGTLIDIETDERRPELWDTLARFLRYQGLPADAAALQSAFFARQQASLETSLERYPELNVPGMFEALLRELGYNGDAQLALAMTRLLRTLSIVRFGLFPDSLATLQALHGRFKLGLMSDAQRVFLEPEISMLGLQPLFDAVVVSSDYGFRKPDPRLFAVTLQRLEVPASQAVFVGDNAERDVRGAQSAGLQAVLLARRTGRKREKVVSKPDKRVATLDALRRWLLE